MATTVALNVTPVLVPAAETDLLGPVPAGHEYDLPVIRFVNNDVNPHQITIWNKPSAAAGTDAELEAMISVQAQSTYEHGPMVLAAGRRVSVKADVANVLNAIPHGWDTTY